MSTLKQYYHTIKDLCENYTFVLPAVAMFLVFSIYPFYKVFQLSLYSWDGIVPFAMSKWIGFKNFIEVLFQDTPWWVSMKNAGIITFLALTVQNALALILALACDGDIKGGHIYRVIFYLPPVLSGIVVGLIWNWIYDGDYGLLNHMLTNIGLGDWVRAWLADKNTALYCVATIHMWKGFGWGFVILLAGLQNIPRSLYEAARVDGAGGWRIFTHITVPLMIPVFILVSILTILGTMQIFDIIASTTQGGPGYYTEVPITRIIASMRGSIRFGYACAQGIVFGIILLVLSMMQIGVSRMLKQQ